jgi:SNF2 family DNA or RNA helicase
MDILKLLKSPTVAQAKDIHLKSKPKEKKKSAPKKKKDKAKEQAKEEARFSFRPIGAMSDKSTKTHPKYIPISDEEEFRKFCPVTFYDHQVQAIRWMNSIEKTYKSGGRHVGGVLADVMGLGKTISCLGITYYDHFLARGEIVKLPPKPTLIIATLTLLHHWQNECIQKFKMDDDRVLVYHGTERYDTIEEKIKQGKNPYVVITNYETIQKDNADRTKSRIYTTHWSRVILDEAHMARNSQTSTFDALKKFKTNTLWCVTGSPIMNDPNDIRVLSCLCTPTNPLRYGNALQEMVWKKKFLLRRTKEMLPLPTITIKDIWLDLTPNERDSYQKVEGWAKNTFDDLTKNKLVNKQYQKILLLLVRLRQACDHILLKEGHSVTSSLLKQVKEELGLPLNPFAKRKAEELDDPEEYSENATFLITKKNKKKRKQLLLISDTLIKKQKLEQPLDSQKPTEIALDLLALEIDPLTSINVVTNTISIDTNTISIDSNTTIIDSNQVTPVSSLESALLSEIAPNPAIDDIVNHEDDMIDIKADKQEIPINNEPVAEEEVEELFGNDELEDILEPLETDDIMLKGNNGNSGSNTKLQELENLMKISKDFEYSSKMNYILHFLNEVKEKDPGGKTVIFTQFATMLDLIEIMLLKAGFKLVRFDGRQQNVDNRKRIVHSFVSDDQYTVLLASLKAGGVGLTLTPARYLISVDPWWNSSVESQAFDRIHRIGQTHPVIVIRLLIRNSIEEVIIMTFPNC